MVLQLLLVVIPLGVYGVVIIGAIASMRARRKTRWPFKDGDRLLRGPGESLKRKITKLDETFMIELLGGMFATLLAVASGLVVANWLRAGAVLAIILPLVAAMAVIVGSAFRIIRLWQHRANCFLGWFGERFAADKLRSLEVEGFRLFHDVQGETGTRSFNLDHVAVGPNGVTVIETKTRRKWKGAAGHEVAFDGRMLCWPGGHKDDHGIKQTIANADWLQRWLADGLGKTIAVKRILTLPGWYVHETRVPGLRVVNTTLLPQIIRELPGSLASDDMKLICHRLEERCRDVEE